MDGADMEPNILERLLEEQDKQPCRLELAHLRTITKNFSDAQIIGTGGCGVVYKGVLRNGTVAVKKLFSAHTIGNMFDCEVNSMMMVKHENIVRFLGYCADTQAEAIINGRYFVMGEIRERMLCFEYIKNGSLQNHIKDELRGLKWPERYQIIRGICEGLCYLHREKCIRHMDLKPHNILLGDHMVPKITDFGLARLDEKSQTMSKERLISLGYCAPEYQFHGKISAKSDIYSLGVIILELVTGTKKDPNIAKVLGRWRHRWNNSSEDAPLLWYRQVAKCLDVSQWCKRENPIGRPYIWDIISELDEIDSWDGQIGYATATTFDEIMSCSEDMLGIEPLEMHFPFAVNEPMSCSIELNNDTDDHFAFRIDSTSLLPFSTQPDKGIVEPRSKLSVTVTLQAQDKAQLQNHCSEEFSVQSSRIDGILTSMDLTKDMFDDAVGKVVDVVNLTVVFDLPPAPEEAQIDMDSMKYQEADITSGEPHSRADNGSLGPSTQVQEEPLESMLPKVLHDPRYDIQYTRWLDDHGRRIAELQKALHAHLQEGELRAIVDDTLSHHDNLFYLKVMMAKSDVFRLISGVWTSPAERCFLWMGGFRPSDLLKTLLPQLDPLTEHQVIGICNLHQESQQAEEALCQGLERLLVSLSDTMASGSLIDDTNTMSYMGQMAPALVKVTHLENVVIQADNLRQNILHEMHKILTVRQATRCFLAIGEYHNRLRALSSLWDSRPQEILMADEGNCGDQSIVTQPSPNQYSAF